MRDLREQLVFLETQVRSQVYTAVCSRVLSCVGWLLSAASQHWEWVWSYRKGLCARVKHYTYLAVVLSGLLTIVFILHSSESTSEFEALHTLLCWMMEMLP